MIDTKDSFFYGKQVSSLKTVQICYGNDTQPQILMGSVAILHLSCHPKSLHGGNHPTIILFIVCKRNYPIMWVQERRKMYRQEIVLTVIADKRVIIWYPQFTWLVVLCKLARFTITFSETYQVIVRLSTACSHYQLETCCNPGS